MKEFMLSDLSNVTRVPMLPDIFGLMNGELEWSENEGSPEMHE